jgi:hypothetical protein
METLSYSEGMALFIALCIAVYIAWLGLTSRPSRQWIRRMQRIQDGRRRQQAEWIASNTFPQWRKHD